jgi:hypothetical protein
MSKSFAPQVKTGAASEWAGNALRFATREEAEANVANLMQRWMLVTDTRVVESDDPPNYRWTEAGLAAVDSDEPPIMPAVRVKL